MAHTRRGFLKLAGAATVAAAAVPRGAGAAQAPASYTSSLFTLKPGDIFFTGTPSGVIAGMAAEKQVWLKPGDQVSCSVEKCGELRFSLAGSQV